MTEIIESIANVGFPIALCFYFIKVTTEQNREFMIELVKLRELLENSNDEIKRMTNAINNLKTK